MLIKIYLNYKAAGSNFQFVFQGQFKRSSGCDNPLNAKPENVKAMIQATVDYAV